MLAPLRIIRRYVCERRYGHELDWVWYEMTGTHCCRHCRTSMQVDLSRSYVGLLNPSSGD